METMLFGIYKQSWFSGRILNYNPNKGKGRSEKLWHEPEEAARLHRQGYKYRLPAWLPNIGHYSLIHAFRTPPVGRHVFSPGEE